MKRCGSFSLTYISPLPRHIALRHLPLSLLDLRLPGRLIRVRQILSHRLAFQHALSALVQRGHFSTSPSLAKQSFSIFPDFSSPAVIVILKSRVWSLSAHLSELSGNVQNRDEHPRAPRGALLVRQPKLRLASQQKPHEENGGRRERSVREVDFA